MGWLGHEMGKLRIVDQEVEAQAFLCRHKLAGTHFGVKKIKVCAQSGKCKDTLDGNRMIATEQCNLLLAANPILGL